MKVTVKQGGAVVGDALVKSGELRPGTFAGSWSGYEVTSSELPDLVIETTIGIRGRVDVTIEVAS